MTRGIAGTAVLNPHGTVARYRAERWCPCQPCRDAIARDKNLRRLDPTPRSVDSTGTARRLQALAALGWSSRRIGDEVGFDATYLRALQRQQARWLHRSTADRIAAGYDRLSMARPPSSTPHDRAAVARAQNHARRLGWVPPLAWDDDTIDDPAASPDLGGRGDGVVDELAVARVLAGEAVNLNRAERAEVIPVLAARGMSDAAIAALVGCVAETVLRARAALGVESRWCA